MKIGPYETGRVYQGDCIDLMKRLPDDCIPMIWTDPPYGSDFNNGDLIHRWEAAVGVTTTHEAEARPILNDGREDMERVVSGMLDQAGRVLQKSSCVCCCCCCGGGGPTPLFAWLANRMDKKPLRFFHAVVWDKGGLGMGWRYRRNYEFVMVSHRKGGKLLWAWDGSGLETGNVVRLGKILPRADQHPTEKPTALVEHFLKLHTTPKDLVLDPFAGSGATGVACARMGRPFLGFELDPQWVKHANDRISAAQRGLTTKQSLGGQRTVFEAMKP